MSDRFCITCAFCKINNDDPNLSLCIRRDDRDPVTGGIKKVWCNIERQGSSGCGADGRHYVKQTILKPSEVEANRFYHGDGDYDISFRKLTPGS